MSTDLNTPAVIVCDSTRYTYVAGSVDKGIITGMGPRGGEHCFVLNRPSGRWLHLFGNLRKPRESPVSELRLECRLGTALAEWRKPAQSATPNRLAHTYNQARGDAGVCTVCGGAMNCTTTDQYLERRCINLCSTEKESLSALGSYVTRHGLCSKQHR